MPIDAYSGRISVPLRSRPALLTSDRKQPRERNVLGYPRSGTHDEVDVGGAFVVDKK